MDAVVIVSQEADDSDASGELLIGEFSMGVLGAIEGPADVCVADGELDALALAESLGEGE